MSVDRRFASTPELSCFLGSLFKDLGVVHDFRGRKLFMKLSDTVYILCFLSYTVPAVRIIYEIDYGKSARGIVVWGKREAQRV